MVQNNEQWKSKGNSNAEGGQCFIGYYPKMNNTNANTGEEREECARMSTKSKGSQTFWNLIFMEPRP